MLHVNNILTSTHRIGKRKTTMLMRLACLQSQAKTNNMIGKTKPGRLRSTGMCGYFSGFFVVM